MTIAGFSMNPDPRLAAHPEELDLAGVRSAPEVGRRASVAEGMGLAVGLIGAVAVGGFTILSLANHHAAAAASPPPAAKAFTQPSAPRLVPSAVVPVAVSATAPASPASAPPASTPILVMDSSAPQVTPPGVAPKTSSTAADLPKPDASSSQNDQFTARVNEERVPTSHVQRIDHPDKVIAQGSVIPAVLETALDSDLPGYTRALVSRDVSSFDGSKVLIPRGSRLVGQYKSALETGQSRMLIVWTRVLRPDGITIQLGSPTTDDLGEAGLSGKVDRHFLQRYGSAILLSVVGGLASVAGSTNTVVIGTATQGTSAASVALQNDVKISPTVRVAQGTPIQVFVARDLDFSEDAP